MQAEGHNSNIEIKDVKNVTDLGEARKNKDRKGQTLPSGSTAQSQRTEDDLTRELLSLYDIPNDCDDQGEGE